MTTQELQKYARRLHSRVPLVGKLLRRSACRKLAQDRSAKVIAYLVEALSLADGKVQTMAEEALRSLKKQPSIDAFCQAWYESREKLLGEIIAVCGYVAEKPVSVRVYSALQAGKRELACEAAESVLPLVRALSDKDNQICGSAQGALRSLKTQAAIDALCEAVISNPQSPAAAIIKEKDSQPRDIGRRCLLFLFTGQYERLLDLDFDFSYLRAEYRAADDTLRRRIGEVVRSSGDSRLVGLFQTGGGIKDHTRKAARELEEREAAIVMDVYARNGQWEDIFSLLFHIPLVSAVRALDLLAKAQWQPAAAPEAGILQELLAARQEIKAVPEKVAGPQAALGALMAKWIAEGRDGAAAQQSAEALQETLQSGSPPEAVPALAALALKNPGREAAREAARNHPHWLVRLAWLYLLEHAPEFIFSGPPQAPHDGGRLWLDQLAPVLLDQALYRQRPWRLNPDQLTFLQREISANSASGERRRWGKVLEILARHHLRHTIEVDEGLTVAIDETAIEIEDPGERP